MDAWGLLHNHALLSISRWPFWQYRMSSDATVKCLVVNEKHGHLLALVDIATRLLCYSKCHCCRLCTTASLPAISAYPKSLILYLLYIVLPETQQAASAGNGLYRRRKLQILSRRIKTDAVNIAPTPQYPLIRALPFPLPLPVMPTPEKPCARKNGTQVGWRLPTTASEKQHTA